MWKAKKENWFAIKNDGNFYFYERRFDIYMIPSRFSTLIQFFSFNFMLEIWEKPSMKIETKKFSFFLFDGTVFVVTSSKHWQKQWPIFFPFDICKWKMWYGTDVGNWNERKIVKNQKYTNFRYKYMKQMKRRSFEDIDSIEIKRSKYKRYYREH